MQQDSRGTVLDRMANAGSYLRDGQPGSSMDIMTTTAATAAAAGGSDGGSMPRSQLVIASSASPDIDADVYDAVSITALAVNITAVTVSGTLHWRDGRGLTVSVKDNGSARTIAWGPAFAAGAAALPTTTTPGQTLTATFAYSEASDRWVCQTAVSGPS